MSCNLLKTWGSEWIMGICLALRDLNIMILNWKWVYVKFISLEFKSSPSPNLSDSKYVVHLIYNKGVYICFYMLHWGAFGWTRQRSHHGKRNKLLAFPSPMGILTLSSWTVRTSVSWCQFCPFCLTLLAVQQRDFNRKPPRAWGVRSLRTVRLSRGCKLKPPGDEKKNVSDTPVLKLYCTTQITTVCWENFGMSAYVIMPPKMQIMSKKARWWWNSLSGDRNKLIYVTLSTYLKRWCAISFHILPQTRCALIYNMFEQLINILKCHSGIICINIHLEYTTSCQIQFKKKSS